MKSTSMDFDTVLNTQLKPCGRYQVFVVCVMGIMWLVAPFHSMGITFMAATPKHHCQIPVTSRVNVSHEDLVDMFIPKNPDGSLDQCKVYKEIEVLNRTVFNSSRYTISKAPGTKACSSYVYDKSQYTSSVITEMGLVCDQKYKVSFFYTSSVIGVMISQAVYSYAIDVYGRRPTYIAACTGTFLCSVALAFISNFYLFCIVRGLMGFFESGSGNTSFVIGLEIVGPQYRTHVNTILMLAWALGYMLVAGLAYLIRDHVTLIMVMAGIISLVFFSSWFVPESPRWLLSKGRETEAYAICRRIAKYNGVVLPTDFTIVADKEEKKSGNPCDLFKTRTMIRNTAVLFFGWISVTFVYYGISWNTSSLGGDDYLNFFISAAVEFPATLFSYFILEKFGRRWTTALSMFISGVLLFLILPIPNDMFIPRVVLAMSTKFLITAAFILIYQYTVELLPTYIRALGFGWCSATARIGSLTASNILLLSAIHPALPTVLLATFSLVSGLLFCFTPETKGMPLPATVTDVFNLDGDSPAVTCCLKKRRLSVQVQLSGMHPSNLYRQEQNTY